MLLGDEGFYLGFDVCEVGEVRVDFTWDFDGILDFGDVILEECVVYLFAEVGEYLIESGFCVCVIGVLDFLTGVSEWIVDSVLSCVSFLLEVFGFLL